jgi:tetratricopeptide (TPR) repeat protein
VKNILFGVSVLNYKGITYLDSANNKNYLRASRVTLLLILLCINLGCTTTDKILNTEVPLEGILHDDAFPEFNQYPIEPPAQIFALNSAAKMFVRNSTIGIRSDDDKAKNLMVSIFDRANLDLIYESSANTTATETFNSAAANCLSLTIMTYAMAEEAGFAPQFQIVDIPEYWTRRSGYTFISGHVNLRITFKGEIARQQLFNNALLVDFDPQTRVKKFFTKGTNKQTIVGMFYNNKGADALSQGNSDKAYAYFKAALLSSNSHAGTWVNLGLLYRKMGLYERAHKAYTQAIVVDKNYSTAWENLAFLYDRTGNFTGAAEIRSRLESKRMNNPFYHQMLAEINNDEGNFVSSVYHYEKAIRLDNSQHQFYFGLASVHFKMRDYKKSKQYLKIAKKKAGKSKIVNAYASKLDALSSYMETIKNAG